MGEQAKRKLVTPCKHKKIKVFWDYSLNKISILCRLYISRKKNTKMKQKVRRTIRTKKAMKACHKALVTTLWLLNI